MNLIVLYEDNHLIAVYKPAGVLAQPDETHDEDLMTAVKKYLKEKYKKPGNVFLGLAHRLDRPVSGIVLFAKTSKGASRLSAQFREAAIEKIYYAVVRGRFPEKKGMLVNYLVKDANKKKAFEGEGKRAELSYEVVKSSDKYSLLKIKLHTGKFHQIRAQLSLIGFPIVGDVKYGYKEPLPDKSIALCESSISFKLATANELKKIEIPLPLEWNKYI
ncbi:MAG: RluA family pseudouridine synthase [Candidatus Nealsonbacteria bacterium]|nr:RluA family pseudouridine synthase [Candidatus Nealsonbacteria bacterium]